MNILPIPNPPPMPCVTAALLHIKSIGKATDREAWNKTQVQDILNSVKFFVEAAEKSLVDK
jgi:hypothetical protein